MKSTIALLLVGFSLPSFWRETNSRAESARAMQQYAKRDYARAAASFRNASSTAPSPLRDFNAGTAEIASGGRAQGVVDLSRALRDPALRGDAYFNRGNAELMANDVEAAIRDYTEALRAAPQNAAAKRNLEIAITKKQEREERSKSQGENPQSGKQPNPSPRIAPGQGQPAPQNDVDAEGILRSVQQQEQEELMRMRQRPASGHVGW